LVYKLFILKKLFVTRKFVLLGWQSKSKLKDYINFKKDIHKLETFNW